MHPPVVRPVASSSLLLASLLLLFVLGASTCSPKAFEIVAPADGLLTADGPVALKLRLRGDVDPASLVLLVDGQPAQTTPLVVQNDEVTAELLGLAPGVHQLEVQAGAASGGAAFETVVVDRPGSCEVLNQVECVLPFPSSRFLEPADTETGYRVVYEADTLPDYIRITPPLGNGPLSPVPYLKNDGFSPTVQVLMNFPGGVDWAASGAPVIVEPTRTYTARGQDADSPTLLIDWESGERVIHWVENDVRGDPATDRVLTFLRPGVALLDGHRYIVAVRDVVDGSGGDVAPEPVFAAIRDGRPIGIPEVAQRSEDLAGTLERLEQLGVDRSGLVLAFDFVVQSQESLTGDMLSMRDQALDWLAQQEEAGTQTWTVTKEEIVNPACADPDVLLWKFVEGTYQVPLFLDKDPFFRQPPPTFHNELSFLLRDAEGRPTWNTLVDTPFGFGIPCNAFDNGQFEPLTPIILGHGLFGTGASTVSGLRNSPQSFGFDFVAAGANWSGLSSPDTRDGSGGGNLLASFVVKVIGNPDLFDAMPDRLRQGETSALVLARMMARGAFNADPAFGGPNGEPSIDVAADPVYIGGSLGGIMGAFFAALTPDIELFNVDVPAVNFSLLLQRATPFIPFQNFVTNLQPDPMRQAIGIGLNSELWARGEPAGYVNHVTGNRLPPLPGSFPKKMLVTVALHDQQVSNLASQLLGSSLGIGVHEGSVMKGLAGMPDTTGPQSSAYIVWDTLAFDLNDPAQVGGPYVPPVDPIFDPIGIVPPLVNLAASPNRCDPHNRRSRIPAAIDQFLLFLAGGQIENFCTDDGVCNGSEPYEIPGGESVACEPFPPAQP
jgi:hypothetical protein